MCVLMIFYDNIHFTMKTQKLNSRVLTTYGRGLQAPRVMEQEVGVCDACMCGTGRQRAEMGQRAKIKPEKFV